MSFDNYAHNYSDIINSVSRLSGETYESIIKLRMAVLRDEMDAHLCDLPDLNILDFGCGTGTTEICLRQHFPHAVITGVDSSAESIRMACQQEIESVTFIHSDAAALPFADECFDLIYTNGTIHHIPAEMRPAVLADLRRVLKPAGTLCIFENNPFNPLTVRSMRQNPFDKGLQAVKPDEIKLVATHCGLVPFPERYYFFFPRRLSWLRPLERYLKRVPLGAQYALRLKRAITPEEYNHDDEF
jgi:ubiquinone/menaquinone biosynthesis C-methylase UbiE